MEDPEGEGYRGVRRDAEARISFAFAYLAPGIATRPMAAPPYLLVYGGAALILGLLVGLMLCTAAVMVLQWRDSVAD